MPLTRTSLLFALAGVLTIPLLARQPPAPSAPPAHAAPSPAASAAQPPPAPAAFAALGRLHLARSVAAAHLEASRSRVARGDGVARRVAAIRRSIDLHGRPPASVAERAA